MRVQIIFFSIQSSSSSTSECWWCWTNLWNGTNRLMSNYLCQSRIQNQDPTSECWCHWYQCLDSTSPLLMKSTICWFCISYLYFLFVFLYFVFLYFVFSYFGHCWWVLVPLSAPGFLLASPYYQLFPDSCIFVFFTCILGIADCWWVLVPLSPPGFLLASPNYQLFADFCISYWYFVFFFVFWPPVSVGATISEWIPACLF